MHDYNQSSHTVRDCLSNALDRPANQFFGRPFVKRFALCYRTVVLYVCLSVLSVTLVHSGQTLGRIKMKRGIRVGLIPGHTVRWGHSYPPPKGHSPPAIFGPYLLRSNGCMDEYVTWYEARPRPRRLCVRWTPRSKESNDDVRTLTGSS